VDIGLRIIPPDYALILCAEGINFESNAAARVQARAGVMWDLWWTKWRWGRFSPSTSVSPTNSPSTDCTTLIIYHLGLVQ
jgi:hypothetical protein